MEPVGSESLMCCRFYPQPLAVAWVQTAWLVQTTGFLRQGQKGKLQVAYKPSRVPPDMFRVARNLPVDPSYHRPDRHCFLETALPASTPLE